MTTDPDRGRGDACVAPTVLVTGAAGFVGGHLLELLEREGVTIVAWRRPGEALPPPPIGRRSCHWMEVDVLDREAVVDAVAKAPPSVVYHLAGAAHAGRSWDRVSPTLQVNVLGTHHLMAALQQCPGTGCRVLVPGSSLVYAQHGAALREDDPVRPDSPYGLSKLAQELTAAHAAAGSGLDAILTRSFNHIGPRQDASFFAASFARQVALAERNLSEPVLRVGNLDARRDLTDVRDTVRAYAALMQKGRAGRVYNVCSGRAYRVGDVLDGLLSRATARIAVHRDPALQRPHDTALVLGSHDRITAEIGWAPEIPIEQTLDDLLDYWRDVVRAASNT